jgi:hypothetical protein
LCWNRLYLWPIFELILLSFSFLCFQNLILLLVMLLRCPPHPKERTEPICGRPVRHVCRSIKCESGSWNTAINVMYVNGTIHPSIHSSNPSFVHLSVSNSNPFRGVLLHARLKNIVHRMIASSLYLISMQDLD